MELSRQTWQRSQEKLHHYKRRCPEETSLYRIIYNYREEFEYRYEELFQQQYGFLRKNVLDSLDAYLNCGILRHGCALVTCEKCEHSSLIAFSCKRRGVCPSCAAKRAHIFAERLHEEILLPYPHKHAVFTIPKRLRVYFKYNHKLNKHLYLAAYGAWSEYLQSKKLPGRAAVVMSRHSAGDLLNFHPHIHSMLLAGTIDDENQFHQLDTVDEKALETLFADKLLDALLREELITEDIIDNINSWEHSGFRAWLGDDISANNSEQRLFIARYLEKCPVSLKRIEILDNALDTTIRYYKKDDPKEQYRQYRDFSPLHFLAELFQHVPDLWEQTTRYYGYYSSRTRGAQKRDERFRALLENNFEPLEITNIDRKRPTQYWATWIKKVYEIDPMECPKCGGEMKIKSFILNPKEISRICKSLGIKDWRAPPPITSSGVKVDYSPEFQQ